MTYEGLEYVLESDDAARAAKFVDDNHHMQPLLTHQLKRLGHNDIYIRRVSIYIRGMYACDICAVCARGTRERNAYAVQHIRNVCAAARLLDRHGLGDECCFLGDLFDSSLAQLAV